MWYNSTKMAFIPSDENRITYFAETDARNRRLKFGIKAKDRTRHVYVIGKTGMGKSTLLENMAVQDIQNGEGMAFIDPHGKTADLLLEYVPQERIRDVIYIAPFDTDYPISFNVLESVDPTKRHLVAGGLMSTFKKIWEDAWSARMEYILTNTLLALLEAPGSTLLGVNRMLSDKEYRKEIVAQVQDPSVKAFWVKEFANYTERMAAEAVPAIQNKVGQFTANPLIRNMIGQPVSSFDFREAMDSRKIIVINLSKGRIGDENMKLLGGLLVTKIYLAAMSRADVPDRVMKMLPNFYLFVDEFQNFANASFADILSEARKYKLNLTIAHQYIEQMDETVRPAVFGNVGTMMAFRVGATDAEALEQEFAPTFTIEDLVNLGFAQIYLKLMIDGLSSAPFSATTLAPIDHPDTSYVTEIIAASREQFARPRAEVEATIIKFHEPTPRAVPASKATASVPSPSAAASAPTTPSASPSPSPKPAQTSSTSAPVRSVSSAPARSVTSAPIEPQPKAQVIPAPPRPPSAPAAAATHQPFKSALSEALNSVISAKIPPKPMPKPAPTVPQPPRSAPSSPIASALPTNTPTFSPAPAAVNATAPMPAPAPAIKPVSLSSLAAKPSPKQDPKKPSEKNVNDLKNALAAVLGKGTVPAASTQTPQNIPRTSTPSSPSTISKAPVPDSNAASPKPAPAPKVQPTQALKPSASATSSSAASLEAEALTSSTLKPIPKIGKSSKTSKPKSAPSTSSTPASTTPSMPQPPREVPEDVLKKILGMEK